MISRSLQDCSQCYLCNVGSMDREEILVEQERSDQELKNPAKRRKENLTLYSASRRTCALRCGTDWNQASTCQRQAENVRSTLHKLGACFAIPELDLDYLKFRVRRAVPPRSQCHQVCKLCARGGTNGTAGDSSISILRRVIIDLVAECVDFSSLRAVSRESQGVEVIGR